MMGAAVFDGCASGFTVYYLDGVMGFSNPWYGYPTAVIARQDGDYRYTVTDGNATITGYTGAGGAYLNSCYPWRVPDSGDWGFCFFE